ncbi:MAG: DUF4346 domain-containing protein [Chloroflexota bacterium]|nr:DUF4346 domain-containing protein [Chloroflexota bacterium]
MESARRNLTAVRYDCLGCEPCYPAVALNALNRTAAYAIEGAVCATEAVEERTGWPPLPGDYTVLRYRAPVAVCTLTDTGLLEAVAAARPENVAIAGTLQTENLGIERLIRNVGANPHIRSLILCGPDSERTIGHLPGKSLLALAASGVDDRMRIIGAPGKRPHLKNVTRQAVDRFRAQVEVIDLIGVTDVPAIIASADEGATRSRRPLPSAVAAAESGVRPMEGYLPERMTSDPKGYFVIYIDRSRRLLSLEHYHNSGVLNAIFEGHSAAELYIPATEEGLVSRLDHAAYLGRELARAERALAEDAPYVQDGAPETAAAPATSCGCGSSCTDHTEEA